MLIWHACGRERRPDEAEFWLKGASWNGNYYPKGDMSVKDFILMMEEYAGSPLPQDLWWLHRLCNELLGRNYKSHFDIWLEELEEEHKQMEESGIIKNIDRTKSKR